jgi:hypothetical protein
MVAEVNDPELGFVGRPVEMNVQVLHLRRRHHSMVAVATGMGSRDI